MRRLVPLLLLAAALVAVIVLALRGDETAPAPGSDGPAADEKVHAAVAVATAEPAAAAAEHDLERIPTPAPPVPAVVVEPPATTAELTVVVVDAADGHRVAEATVAVIAMVRLRSALDAAGTTMHEPAGRRIRAALASRGTTDDRGEAVVAAPEGALLIEAFSDAGYGAVVQQALPADRRVTVALDADQLLNVQVLDVDGAPRGGVPVALRRQDRAPPDLHYSSQFTVTEPPLGIARFEHVQRRLAQGAGWHATFAFPVRGEPAVAVDATTPSAPPIRLQLPATGHLRIEVRDAAGGIPVLDDVHLHLAARADGVELWPEAPWSRPALDPATGIAELEWLGLGLELTVTATHGRDELAAATIAGPRQADETVRCTLVAGTAQGSATAFGRLVRADGEPWPAATVNAWLRQGPISMAFRQHQQIAVAADGRFRLPLPRDRVADAALRCDLSGQHPDGSGQCAVEFDVPAPPPDGDIDLGDVVLDHGPRLVAGVVLDHDRRPLAGARLRVLARSVVDGKEYWPQLITNGTWRTIDDGRFALFRRHGDADPGIALRLVVECEGHAPVRDLPFTAGATDVVVVLPAAGELAGSFALGAEGSPSDLRVTLRRAGTPPRPVQVARDATFAVRDLPVDVYTLTAHRRGVDGRFEKIAFAEITGLQVMAGEPCRDPRIQQIPVPIDGASVRITVVDARGTPISAATATCIGDVETVPVHADPDGICHVRTLALPVALEIDAFGHRPQRLAAVDRDRRVVMAAGIPIVLRCGARTSGHDPSWSLGVFLYHDDGARGRREIYADTFPPLGRHFDARDEFAVAVPAAGDYLCELMLFTSGKDRVGRGAWLPLPSPLRLHVAEATATQTFDLAIPQSAIDAALERALR